MFLLIENKGVAPIEAFTVLGDSGTRHRTNAGLIGQFGSGTKHGINLLLRERIPFKIYTGKTCLTFFVESTYVTEADGLVRESYPVKCRLSGDSNRTIDCGWTLEFGALDWTETSMALREFVSNCLDCSTIMGTKPVIKPEANARAKAGTTRIFVDLDNSDVSLFHRELGKHFLHLSGDPSQVNQQFLPKNPDSVGPRIYREGVFVRELCTNFPSVFDYNFSADEIEIDECRNSSEYSLRAVIARKINRADSPILRQLFEAMEKESMYESTLDEFYLGYHKNESEKVRWACAWASFADQAVIATETMGNSDVAKHVCSKGHAVKVIKSDTMVKVAEAMGVPSILSVLGEAASKGNVEVDTTPEAVAATKAAWNLCVLAGMTNEKTIPEVKCFKQLMDKETVCLGYYISGDTIFLREDLAGRIAIKVALEEIVHYITGSTDLSRDFQNFAFDMIVELNT